MHDGDLSPIGHAVPHIKSDEILDGSRREFRLPPAEAQSIPGAVSRFRSGCRSAAKATRSSRSMRKETLLVSTAMLDQGAGTHTAMRLVAAEELQLPLEKIRIATLDTSKVGPDTGIGASRGTRIFGNAPVWRRRRRKSNCSTLPALNSALPRNSFL